MIWLCLCLSITWMGYAQPHEERAKQHWEKMAEELKLTEEQRLKMNEINDQYLPQIAALKNAQGENREAIEKLRRERQEKVKALLTKEQAEQLEALKKERKDRNKEMQKELRQYRKENILPVLRVHRSEFDKLLTEEEKKIITDLSNRQKMLKTHQMGKEKSEMGKESKGKDGKKGKNEMMDKQRVNFRKDCKEKLKPIIEAHKAELQKVDSDLEGQRLDWENQMKMIREKYKSDRQEGTEIHPRNDKSDKKQEQRWMHFLLINPNGED